MLMGINIIRLIILFVIIYAIIKNLKTLLKAALIVFGIFLLLGIAGY